MERIIRAKHWQIFIVVVALPVLFDIIIEALLFQDNNPRIFQFFYKWSSVYVILCIFIWTWAIGIGLQSEIPAHLRMKVGRFKASLLLPSFYIIFMQIFEEYISLKESLININKVNILDALIFACICYAFFYTAKTIKTIQFQREATFWKFAFEFLMIYFFPIGVWILQPRINKMINK